MLVLKKVRCDWPECKEFVIVEGPGDSLDDRGWRTYSTDHNQRHVCPQHAAKSEGLHVELFRAETKGWVASGLVKALLEIPVKDMDLWRKQVLIEEVIRRWSESTAVSPFVER